MQIQCYIKMRPHVVVVIKCLNLRRSARIVAWTSLSVYRSEQDDTMDTVSSENAYVSLFQDTTNNLHIRNSDHHTKDKISNFQNASLFCSIVQNDILDFNNTEQHCVISKCGTKICNILITDAHFTSLNY